MAGLGNQVIECFELVRCFQCRQEISLRESVMPGERRADGEYHILTTPAGVCYSSLSKISLDFPHDSAHQRSDSVSQSTGPTDEGHAQYWKGRHQSAIPRRS